MFLQLEELAWNSWAAKTSRPFPGVPKLGKCLDSEVKFRGFRIELGEIEAARSSVRIRSRISSNFLCYLLITRSRPREAGRS